MQLSEPLDIRVAHAPDSRTGADRCDICLFDLSVLGRVVVPHRVVTQDGARFRRDEQAARWSRLKLGSSCEAQIACSNYFEQLFPAQSLTP
jgi:hypothetical protein